MLYKIVRSFHGFPDRSGHLNSWRRTVRRGLTLAQARAHCRNPETSWEGTGPKARRITRRCLCPWFDTYTEDR